MATAAIAAGVSHQRSFSGGSKYSHNYENFQPVKQLRAQQQQSYENCRPSCSSNRNSPSLLYNTLSKNTPIHHPKTASNGNVSPHTSALNTAGGPSSGGTVSENGTRPEYTTIPSYPSAGSLLTQRVVPQEEPAGTPPLPVKQKSLTETQRSYTTGSTNSVSVTFVV